MIATGSWEFGITGRPGTVAAVCDKAFVRTHSRSLAPGVTLTSYQMGTAQGPIRAWAIAASPSMAQVIPIAACDLPASASSAPRLWPVSVMASASGAVAAVNGGYFSWGDHLPVGLLEIGGKWIGGAIYGRAAIALSGGPPRIERIGLQPWFELPDGESAEVDFLNFPQQADSLELYTSAWGDRTDSRPQAGSFEVALSPSGRVLGLGTADLGIPPKGFVLAGTGAHGDWLQAHVCRGDTIALHDSLQDYWGDRPDVVGGGPILVSDGSASVQDDRFPADITQGANARTAIGLERDGTILVVGVAGGGPQYSVGMTLPELADFMVSLGAQEAMNLDGGGSTTVWADGRDLNEPSDGQERPVADALAVIPTPAETVTTDRSESVWK